MTGLVDADGLPHRPYDTDVEGVPTMYPTCGQDGRWWPCPEAIRQGWTEDD